MIGKQHIPYFIIAGLLLVAVGAVASAVYFSQQYRKSEEAIKNPREAAQEEVNKLIAKVGTLMILPTGMPTVATVSDINGLSGQPFFANAQNGDQVLVYADARKAILYRPKDHIIVEVAPVTLSDPKNTASGSADLLSSLDNPIRVAIRNGTTTIGVAKALEDELKSKIPKVTVTEKDNAKTLGLAKTIVIDLTGRESEVATRLAEAVGATVGVLPQGEPKPNADFLILIGADRK